MNMYIYSKQISKVSPYLPSHYYSWIEWDADPRKASTTVHLKPQSRSFCKGPVNIFSGFLEQKK